ncbi:MAG: O-antigen ligase family protein [Patescibacteria group bacterium]|nr:O-antigen ligase family protein [Patescibacteria group bacterium]
MIEYGLYALVFLLPWQTKLILRQGNLGGGDWEYGTIALYGTDILLIGLLILFLISYWQKKSSGDNKGAVVEPAITHPVAAAAPPLPGRGIIIILSGLDLFLFLSIFFAPDTILAAYRYVLFLLGLGLFWLIIKAEYSRTKLAIAFFSSLIIQGGLAIGQFLLQNTFAFKWLGLAIHYSSDLGVSVIETLDARGIPERWLRAYGSLDHPNILGGLLAIGLTILVCIYLQSYFEKNKITNYPGRAPWPRAGKLKIINFFTFYFLLFTLFAALIFTFSRSAALALAVGLILSVIFYLFKKDRPALKRLGLIAVMAAVLFGIIFFNYQDLFITRAQDTSRLELKSISERKTYQDDSLGLIKKNWLFGSGIGNYTKALAEKDPQRSWDKLNPVHNVFLLVWSESGIFGLLFFTALLVYLFVGSFRKKIILNLSILSILVIIMMFDHYLWSLHFGILLFWLSIGFVYKSLNKYYG